MRKLVELVFISRRTSRVSSRNGRMKSVVLFISTTCCFLVNTQLATASALPKPVLKLVTQHPKNIIVKGDSITWKCLKGSEEANAFSLVHTKESGGNETLASNSNELLFTNIQTAKNGEYFCQYCEESVCSELSSSWKIYVRESFPRPEIIVSPRRVVQPGATITITCRAYYSDVQFSLLKNDKIVTNGSSVGNQFSYVISDAKQSSAGYYSCIYQSKSRGMQSVRSNPMKISIIELPAPSMTWEEDPNDSTMLTINCTATDNKYTQLFFMFLDGNKVIEDNHPVSSVNFSIAKPVYTVKRYQCMYRVKLDSDYADSLYSILQIGSNGFYMVMFIRHILSALILILIGIILLLHFKKKDETRPELPPPRVRYRKEKEETGVKW